MPSFVILKTMVPGLMFEIFESLNASSDGFPASTVTVVFGTATPRLASAEGASSSAPPTTAARHMRPATWSGRRDAAIGQVLSLGFGRIHHDLVHSRSCVQAVRK